MQNRQLAVATEARTWWARALDGQYRWGSFDVWVGRYGMSRYRLTVFSPGIGAADRRLARLWRAWPNTGAVLWLLAVMFLSNTVSSPRTTVVVATAVYLGVGVCAAACARCRSWCSIDMTTPGQRLRMRPTIRRSE